MEYGIWACNTKPRSDDDLVGLKAAHEGLRGVIWVAVALQGNELPDEVVGGDAIALLWHAHTGGVEPIFYSERCMSAGNLYYPICHEY
ncbi:hypothetical protein COBE111412_06280 [Corynebacterium belfantii]